MKALLLGKEGDILAVDAIKPLFVACIELAKLIAGHADDVASRAQPISRSVHAAGVA